MSDLKPPPRSGALDALRGFAILAMVLSAVTPNGLPLWMYHAQVPPPGHTFDPTIAGITWVDLVFPFFLFSLGAALPLALGSRLRRGERVGSLMWGGVRRGLLLLFFAVFVQHINPYALAEHNGLDGPNHCIWKQTLIGFGLLFPILIRLPRAVPSVVVGLLRLIGFAGAGWFLYQYWYDAALTEWFNGQAGFSAQTLQDLWAGVQVVAARSDIIIAILAHCVTAGTFIWLLTRRDPAMRMGWMVLVLACTIGAEPEGWLRNIWHTPLLPGFMVVGFLKYLSIVIPGTIVGDLLAGSHRSTEDAQPAGEPWSTSHWFSVLGLTVFLTCFVVAGLQARYLPATPLMATVMALLGFVLLRNPGDEKAQLTRTLYGWGVLWLLAGLAIEAFEGGIKKDNPTISYYLVTSGLAVFSLIAMQVAFETLRLPVCGWLLRDNGQNPMIAYAGLSRLVIPLLAISGALTWIADQKTAARDWLVQRYELTEAFQAAAMPWAEFGWAIILTLILALVVALCTRLRIFWRT